MFVNMSYFNPMSMDTVKWPNIVLCDDRMVTDRSLCWPLSDISDDGNGSHSQLMTL